MKKIMILLFVLLLTGGCASEPVAEIATGWYTDARGTFYLDSNGSPVTGWQWVGQSKYYFHPDKEGAMVTGWLELDGQRYYLRPDGDMAMGAEVIDGKLYHFTSAGVPVLLVNADHPLPEDFDPELVELEGFQVSADCAVPLKEMMEACRKAGHRCVINSSYRDVAYQKTLWDNRYHSYIAQGYSHEAAAQQTSQIVLPPGTSEHHTGLAIDIVGTLEMYSWLEQYAPEYGFILRYPQGKMPWTGVRYEPWHFRYVGKELAQELQAENLTLEEYLYQLTRQI